MSRRTDPPPGQDGVHFHTCPLVDPRRTRTAERADQHLFIRPGTDVQLLLAMAHVLFDESLVRPGRAAAHIEGLESLEVALGPWTPESVGDYCSGTNHVLPTYGFARSYSSLGVNDFLRSMTVQELNMQGLEAIGPTACTLADMEGLDAHAQAVTLRLARIRDAAQ